MLCQDLHDPLVFNNGDAASLTIIECFPMINSFTTPDGIDHGSISIDLHGQAFSFHVLQQINIRACCCDEVLAVKGIAGLGIVHVFF